MAHVALQVKQWGNCLGVRLPAAIAKLLNLHANQQVKLSVETDSIVITPIKEALSDKLARFDPERHGGEMMTDSSHSSNIFINPQWYNNRQLKNTKKT